MSGTRILRLLFRGVLALGLLLVALFGGLYAFTFTDTFRELAREQALALLHGSFRGELGVERIEGSVWGDLRLETVSLRYGGIEVVRIPEVTLRYSLLPLLRGRLEIARIVLRSPAIDLRGDERGQWNLADALQSPPEAPPASGGSFPVSIASLELAEGRISITPCRGSGTCLLDGVALDAAIGVESAGIDADVRRLALRLAAEGLPLGWLDASVRYRGSRSPPRVEVRRLALSTESSRIDLQGALESPDKPRELTADATLTIATLARSDVALFAPQWTLEEAITGTLRLIGPANDLRAHLELAAGQARVRGDVHADAVSATPAADGEIEIHDLDLGRAVQGAGGGGIAQLRANGSVRGTKLAGVRGDARLEIRGASYREWRLGELETTASLAGERASVEGELRGESGKASWKAAAKLSGDERFEATVAVDHLDPKNFARGVEGGDLTLRVSAEGSGLALDRQRSHVLVHLERSHLGKLIVERGLADLRIADRRLRIAELAIDSPDASIRGSGDVALDARARGEAHIQAKLANLAPWLALAGLDGRGGIDLDVSVRGAPADLAAKGKLVATAVGVSQSSIERGVADFDFRGLGGASPAGRLAASITGVQAAVSLRSANLEAGLSTARGAESRPRLVADTTLGVQDLTGRNHRTKLRIAYEAAAVSATISELHLEPPEGSLDLRHPAVVAVRGGAITLDGLDLAGKGPSVAASARLSRSGAQRAQIAIDRLPLEWLRAFSPAAPQMSGSITTHVDVEGTAAAPQIAATMQARDLRIAGQPYAGLRATLDYRQPAAAIDLRFDQDETHALTATARLPLELRWDPAALVRVSGDLDVAARSNGLSLAFLNALSPRTLQRVSGEIVLDVESHGPIERPALRGAVALRGGAAAVPPLGLEVNGATAELSVAPDAIRITKLSAAAADGRLDGGGTISLAGFAPDRLDVRLAVDRWPAIATSRYRSDLSGEIFCRGTAASPDVTGKIEVLWGVLRPDLDFLTKAPSKRDPTIRVVSATATEPSTSAEPPQAPPAVGSDAYKNLALDVTLLIHRNTWINHSNASTELQGQLRAEKRPGQDLRLSGAIETIRGWMVFQGRRFTLSHGVISFTGAPEINPSLDVVADYKRGEYTIHVLLGGTANEPSLKLESEPSLTQADILSVLVFDKPASELNEGQRADMKQRVGQLATSYALSELGESMTEALGLTGRGVHVEELSSERVALGAYVSDRTYVTVGQNVAGKQGQEASVEYELTRSWAVATSTSSDGSSGADVIWKKRY
ncbi:MAG TPA: translocation/assembly module TamB domain-containing protein [Candidatus Binatia bacterium]|nr:translocation/assembly module TamB domain-containing protein [Candidatus Binatia bacterium]